MIFLCCKLFKQDRLNLKDGLLPILSLYLCRIWGRYFFELLAPVESFLLVQLFALFDLFIFRAAKLS